MVDCLSSFPFVERHAKDPVRYHLVFLKQWQFPQILSTWFVRFIRRSEFSLKNESALSERISCPTATLILKWESFGAYSWTWDCNIINFSYIDQYTQYDIHFLFILFYRDYYYYYCTLSTRGVALLWRLFSKGPSI